MEGGGRGTTQGLVTQVSRVGTALLTVAERYRRGEPSCQWKGLLRDVMRGSVELFTFNLPFAECLKAEL